MNTDTMSKDPNVRENHQAALDQAYSHFIRDKRRFSYCENAEDPNHGRYRGDDGSACPVGLLITDEEYTPELEGKAPAVVNNDENPFRFLVEYDLEFLFRLVDAHDECVPIWREGNEDKARLQFELELAHIATDWKLDMQQSSFSPN